MPLRWILAVFALFPSLLPAQSSFSQLSTEADAARDANHLREATSLYRQALKLRPSWAEGWFSLGTIQYDQNLYDTAAQSFIKASQLNPKVGTARVMLGLCEFELDRDAAALTDLQAGERAGFADNPQLRNVAIFHEGLLLQRAGQFEAALTALYPLCQGGVESEQLLTTLGLAALRSKDKSPSTNSVVSVGHAECLSGQKKFDQARSEYSALVQAAPNLPNVHYAYGRFLLQAINDPAAAISEFQKEIKNQPNSALARLQIAAADYKTDSSAGLPYAEAAVKLAPTLPLGHYILGLLLIDTQRDEQAIPELELARKLLPREPGVYYALGSAYAHTGRKDDAARTRAEFHRLQTESATTTLVPQP